MAISTVQDNHINVTIPRDLVRGVFARKHVHRLLLLLADRDEPVRYSEARDALELHPQQFQRAVEGLERFGLLRIRAPADLNKPHAERTYYVHLELTVLGEFCAELWDRFEADYDALVEEWDMLPGLFETEVSPA